MSKELFRNELRTAILERRIDVPDFTQRILALTAGISDTHIGAILNGQRNASPGAVRKIGQALAMSDDEIERWILLTSLPEESKYALAPEDVRAMLGERDAGTAQIIAHLQRIVDLLEQLTREPLSIR